MIGVVLLAHDDLRRTGQMAWFLADQGVRVAIHVDRRTGRPRREALERRLGQHPNILFVRSRPCHWGTFSLVQAALDAISMIFARWPEVGHICHLSGSCLPIKPIRELEAHLALHADVDFIESVPVEQDSWVIDGLSMERFTLYHPFPFRRAPWFFDRSVDLQRAMRVRRRMPPGLEPRIGSQWWCLSARTLRAILNDPERPAYDRFFRRMWIPDESYFQCLAGKHSDRITSRPLTFVRFDPQGKPYIFYDDHLELLLQADGFFARKIWHGADRLYDAFLSEDLAGLLPSRRDGRRLLRRFESAQRLHQSGRRGLISQGRHPGRRMRGQHETAVPYVVLDGIERIYPDLPDRLASPPGTIVHGALFGPGDAEFAGGGTEFTGNISARASIRDHKPVHFLSKLIWVERERTQVFLHDFRRDQPIDRFLPRDPNARILRLGDAWLLDLLEVWREAPDRLASALHDRAPREAEFATRLERKDVHARIVAITLAEALRGGDALAEKLRAALPEPLAGAHDFARATLPDDLPPFLADLRATPQAPAGLEDLEVELARHDTAGRISPLPVRRQAACDASSAVRMA